MLSRLLQTLMLFLVISVVHAQRYYLFAGSYTSNTKSKGIYVFDFDAATGSLKLVSNTDSAANPSFVIVAPGGRHVYAVNEVSRQQTGFVAAYDFNPVTGKLDFINRVPSGSENPCQLSITKDGKWIAVANYTGGSLAMIPVNSNGAVAPFAQHIVHTGKGVNPTRQEKPHVHSAFFSPDDKFLLSPDLGLDKIFIYQVDKKAEQPLSAANPPYAEVNPGTGPRHLAFSSNGKFVYLIDEMGGAVTVFNYQDGKMNALQRVNAHPDGFKGQPGSADIHLSPDGKFLYASNRGEENNIAIFSVDKKTGLLKTEGYQPTGGEHPRNFMIDPTGRYLLAANQRTGNIVVFKRNKDSGQLEKINQVEVPAVSCLQMLWKSKN